MPSHSMPPSTHRRRIDRPPHDHLRTTRWRRTAVASVLVTLAAGGALWTLGAATAHPKSVSLLPDHAAPAVPGHRPPGRRHHRPSPTSAPLTLSPSPSASAGPSAPASTPTAPSTSPSSPSSPTGAATTSAASSGGFPTRASAGLPDGWQPKRSVTGTYTINTPGAVVEDLRVTNGTINVTARNVTLRRVQAVGSVIANYTSATCATGLVIEDSEIVRGTAPTTDEAWPAVTSGGYTARSVLIDGVPEGFRVQGRSACGGVGIYDSYVRVVSPDVCTDWHGDGIQGYGGGALTVRKTVIDFVDSNNCGGTAPFFYPDQDNAAVDIDGLVVSGGGYPFRLGTPGTVRNLYVVDRSWVFGPLDVRCSLVTQWQAAIVTMDSAGQPRPVRDLPCG